MSGVKWGRLAGMIVLGLVLAGMVWWWLSIAADSVEDRLPVEQSQSSDHGGLPHCTDAIADAHGVCWGEPTAEPNGLAETPAPAPTVSSLPVPVITAVPAAAVVPIEVNEDPWLTADDGTRYFEDGSWLELDGTQGCTVGMPCDAVPAPPAGTPTTPDGGYWPNLTLVPCPQEDSDNCYWDATVRGNQQGTSFVTIGGVTYYPEVTK